MKSIGAVNALYPMPTTLVGTTVNNHPNFLTVAQTSPGCVPCCSIWPA
jgi:hypothetical protein